MNLVVRLGLLGLGFAVLFVANEPSDANRMLVASAASGIALAAAAIAHGGRQRPWSDGAAWLGAGVCLVALGTPEASWSRIALVVVGLAALVAGLHVPAVDAPRRRGVGALATWSLVTLAAIVVAWAPVLLAKGDRVAVLDPLTSTGMAMRLAAAAALVWIVAGLLSLRSKRKSV